MLSPLIGEGSVGGGTRSLLRWEGFVEKVCFEPGVKA